MPAQLQSLDGTPFDYPDGGPVLTVAQFEERHIGLKGRTRGLIARSEFNPDLALIRDAVIRIGRSV
jgi:hypothetical protein